jgi:hypothetical protein
VGGLPPAGPADGEVGGPQVNEPLAGEPLAGEPLAGEPLAGEPQAGTPAAAGGTGLPSPEAGAAGKGTAPAVAARPRALQIELAPPPSSVARSLRLGAGELVATVTVSFEDPVARRPVAITTAMLRPDLFRIVIQAGAGPDGPSDGFASVWTHAATGWEP